jgi:hypothetical protein
MSRAYAGVARTDMGWSTYNGRNQRRDSNPLPAHQFARLPAIPIVRERYRAMAVLDAIMSPDWQFRFYSFDSRWVPGEADPFRLQEDPTEIGYPNPIR